MSNIPVRDYLPQRDAWSGVRFETYGTTAVLRLADGDLILGEDGLKILIRQAQDALKEIEKRSKSK